MEEMVAYFPPCLGPHLETGRPGLPTRCVHVASARSQASSQLQGDEFQPTGWKPHCLSGPSLIRHQCLSCHRLCWMKPAQKQEEGRGPKLSVRGMSKNSVAIYKNCCEESTFLAGESGKASQKR